MSSAWSLLIKRHTAETTANGSRNTISRQSQPANTRSSLLTSRRCRMSEISVTAACDNDSQVPVSRRDIFLRIRGVTYDLSVFAAAEPPRCRLAGGCYKRRSPTILSYSVWSSSSRGFQHRRAANAANAADTSCPQRETSANWPTAPSVDDVC